MTSELQDSYFRLMTIKHAIPKIERAIERAIEVLYNSVRQEVSELEFRQVEDKMWQGKPPSSRSGPRDPRWSLETRPVGDKMQ